MQVEQSKAQTKNTENEDDLNDDQMGGIGTQVQLGTNTQEESIQTNPS